METDSAAVSRRPVTQVAAQPEGRVGHPREQFSTEQEIQPGEAEDDTQYPHGIKLVGLMGAVAVMCIAVGFDVAVVAVTIPQLSDQFKSIADIGWYATSLRLVMCSFMFLINKAYTLWKIKPLFIASIAFFEVGNTICTFAPSSIAFIVGRAIAGIGCAGVLAGLYAALTYAIPVAKRPLYGGILGGIETMSALSAPLIGGALIDGWTWRACYGINIPIGIASLIVTVLFLEAPHSPNYDLSWRDKLRQLDLLGTAVFVPMMTCLLMALQWGGITYRWGDPRIIALFIVCAITLGVFAYTQRASRERATLPIRILGNRSILAGAWFSGCMNAVGTLVEYYMSIYFQGVRGLSAARSGIFALPMIAGMSVAAMGAGVAISRIGYYTPFMYLGTILLPIAAGLITTIDLTTSLAKLLPLLFMVGVAIGASIQSPQFAAQTVLKTEDIMIGIAIVQFGQQIGPTLFTSASTTLFTNRLKAEISQSAPGTNITSLLNSGLSDLRQTIGADRLEAILFGYDEAIVQTLYLPLALSCMTLFGSLAMEWRSVKKKTH